MPQGPTQPLEIEKAVKLALTGILSDGAFTHHLAEEIADHIDGIDDKMLAILLDEAAENSAVVSEEAFREALKR